MRLLLDTNILIPLLEGTLIVETGTLGTLVLANAASCFGSAASLWEMTIKSRLGKLPLPCADEDLPGAFALLGLPILGISASHAVKTVDPWPETRDPFDRLLLAVCAVEDARLVTTDGKLQNHPLAWRP